MSSLSRPLQYQSIAPDIAEEKLFNVLNIFGDPQSRHPQHLQESFANDWKYRQFETYYGEEEAINMAIYQTILKQVERLLGCLDKKPVGGKYRSPAYTNHSPMNRKNSEPKFQPHR